MWLTSAGLKFAEFPQNSLGLGDIETGDGESDMGENEVADLDLGQIGQGDLLADTLEIDGAAAVKALAFGKGHDLSWKGKAHELRIPDREANRRGFGLAGV